MKKCIYILAVLCAFAVSGCNKEYVGQAQAIVIVASDTDFPAKGGTGSVQYKVDDSFKGKVEAEASKSWVKIGSVGDDAVVYSVLPSMEALVRSADITLTAGGESQTFTIMQSGVTFDMEGDNTLLEMDPAGSGCSLAYENSISEKPEITVSYEEGESENWLRCLADSKKIYFEADLNLTCEDRTATVTVTLGWKSAVVTVSQAAASAVEYANFGCDANACTSDEIKLAEYALEALGDDWYVEVAEESPWIHYTKIAEGIIINVDQNLTGDDREGAVRIINGSNRVISTLPVRQTHTTINDIAGAYHFPYAAATWVWDLKKGDGNYLLAKAFASALKTDGYKIRLDYTSCGEDAPKLVLKLPQQLGTVSGKERVLWGTVSGYYVNTSCAFDLVYRFGQRPMVFDFKTSAETYYTWPNGLRGVYLTSSGSGENWCDPDPEYGCLYLKRWGSGSHDGFTNM